MLNSDWIESELENCLIELRSICDHRKPPLGGWQKIKAQVIEWWLYNDVGATLIGFAMWIGLVVGLPLLLSMCNSKTPPEPRRSSHGDVVTQYTVTYYEDGAHDWDEVDDEEEEGADDE